LRRTSCPPADETRRACSAAYPEGLPLCAGPQTPTGRALRRYPPPPSKEPSRGFEYLVTAGSRLLPAEEGSFWARNNGTTTRVGAVADANAGDGRRCCGPWGGETPFENYFSRTTVGLIPRGAACLQRAVGAFFYTDNRPNWSRFNDARSVAVSPHSAPFWGAPAILIQRWPFCAHKRTQHPMGDLMLDLPALLAPQRAALYRQLAANLREAAVDGMDDQSWSDFLELARQYDAQAANIWPPEIPRPSSSRPPAATEPHRRFW
jgi:hypothetical protein